MSSRILIVEDAKFNRLMLRRFLEGAGYEVCGEADNGADALIKYAELRPDLMILDIIIPVLEGNVVLGMILKQYPDAKVLIMSSLGDQILVEKALKAGASGYAIKPVSTENVLSEVSRILGK
jgi:two-component system, chemotaxis family, chemotaxis protein CheY